MLFYIAAACLAVLKIASVAGFTAISWFFIVGVALVPLVISMVIVVLVVCGVVTVTANAKLKRR